MEDITIYKKVAEIRFSADIVLSNNFDSEGILRHFSSMGFLIMEIPSKENYFVFGILKKEEKDA